MSPRRVWATARLDLAHNARRPLFWIWLAVLAFFAYMFSGGEARIQSGDSDVGGTKAFITSEFAVAQMLTVFVLLLYAFFVAVAAGMTVLRDEELRVGETIHATPLRPGEYVAGKFLAALASFVCVLALHVAMMAACNHLTGNAEEAEFIGPFAAASYLRPALLLALPTILFLAGVSFWIGERFRKPIAVFFLPVAVLLASVFFLWPWSPSWLPEPVNRLLMWIDPAGFRWLNQTWLEVDRGVEFYNRRPIAYDAPFLASRLVLVALGLGAPVLAARHFARTLRGRRVAPDPPGIAATERAPARRPVVPARLSELGMGARRPGFLGGLVAVTLVELRELRSSPGLYLFVPIIVLEAVVNSMFFTGPFDTTPLLTSGVLAVRTTAWLGSLVCLLLLFYTVESLRREEGSGLASICYATPVRTGSILFGKALANSLVGAVAIGVTLVTCLVVLAVQGHVAPDAGPFLLVWCAVLLPTFLLWCSFVSFLYSLVRSRYTTYALALAAFIATSYRHETEGLTWVWNWPLWGVLQWSDMGTFELVRDELVLNRALALAGTLLFTVLTVKLFPRRRFDATTTLLRMRPKALLKGALRLSPVLAPVLVLAFLLQGRIDAGFQGDAMEKAAKDYWRKNVRTWTDYTAPDLAGVDLELDLFPDEHRFEVQGTFTLENTGSEDLRVVPLTRGFGWRRPDSLADAEDGDASDAPEGPIWTLAGEPFEPDDSAGLVLFHLPEPLPPGGVVDVGFHHSGEVPAGATRNGGGAGQAILPSGVVLHSFAPAFVPTVGYEEDVGVDEDNRSESKQYADDHYLGETPGLIGGGFREYHVRMRVSAPEAYTINCIGVKREETVEDGRRTAVWETDHPVRFFNVVCGKWDVVESEDGRTAIYHHPGHDYNVAAMLAALEASREHYSEWFHPYPWEYLKISEFPAIAGYAMGFATNIPFSESIGFLTKGDEDDADAPFMVTAHEAAHQWWGNILVPGRGPGGNILSEGMAHFSTMLLFEEVKGPKARIAFARQIEDQYGDRRSADSERPLVRIDGSRPGDETVTYDKGGWVFWMLLNHMGRDRCLAGIRSFVAYYSADRDHPLLEDFVEHLRPFAPDPDAYDAFTRQWFLEVHVPQYRLEDVERQEGSSGWTVTLTVTNEGTGVMPVEVAATRGVRFPDEEPVAAGSPPPPTGGPGSVAAAESASPHGGESDAYREVRATVTLGPDESAEVVLECTFEPERVLVDPDALVLQLKRKRAEHEF